jgi:ATP-dependent DNA helicase RecG
VIVTFRVAIAHTQQVTRQVLARLASADDSLPRSSLQEAAGLRDREHFMSDHLNPLITAGLIEMTIPDKPRSRLQKYRLTADGRAWLDRHGRERGTP